MLIGVTGTDGAGKGTLVEYLVKEKGFVHYSSRAEIVKEIRRLGLPEKRAQMRLTANSMRKKEGNEVLVARALEAIERDGAERAIVESIRALAEVELLEKAGGILLAVDANPQVRYQRVQERRSTSDQVTFETFLAHEELERNDPDPHGMQKAAVIERATHTFMNNGTKEELSTAIAEFLSAHGV